MGRDVPEPTDDQRAEAARLAQEGLKRLEKDVQPNDNDDNDSEE